MNGPKLEHVNVTVSNPEQTAKLLSDIFGWHIRWQGSAMLDGHTVHVGKDDCYLALYTHSKTAGANEDTYATHGALNHVGVVVENPEEIERRVIDAGLTPHSHADYETGRRFYFDDHDGIEYEVVHYPEV